MSVSSIVPTPTILTPAIQRAQAVPQQTTSVDHDGDADDHGGPADTDRVDIKV